MRSCSPIIGFKSSVELVVNKPITLRVSQSALQSPQTPSAGRPVSASREKLLGKHGVLYM